MPANNSYLKETCHNFINKSLEKLCDRHKDEQKTRLINKFKAARVGLPAERVDLNVIKRKNQQAIEEKLGAFGGANSLRRDNRPKPQKSVD
jgi:hypothetical protein